MSDFIVSARKYRPVRFDEVVGQGHVSDTLKNALRQNRLAHAFLFCGPRGVGKTTCARILAKVLNCLDVSADYEPCNVCESCVSFNQAASFNIFELDGASNNKVDHMHQLMEQVRVPPQNGRKKVYIIDEVHMLSASAFNAFLKTLEEPPEYAVFILATTEKHKILPTILSRCQVYDFHRIGQTDMVAHLAEICTQEGITAEAEALHLVAEKADGALRDALSVFDRLVSSAPGDELNYAHAAGQLNVLDHGTFFTVVDALLREDAASLYLTFDEVLRHGFEPEPFLGGLAQHLRQLFVCKSPKTISLIEVSDALRTRYAEQAARCGMSFLVNALHLAGECDFRLRTAANKRLHVELYLVKMAYAARSVEAELAVPTGGPASLQQAPPPPGGPTTAGPTPSRTPGGNATGVPPGGATTGARTPSSESVLEGGGAKATGSSPQRARTTERSPGEAPQAGTVGEATPSPQGLPAGASQPGSAPTVPAPAPATAAPATAAPATAAPATAAPAIGAEPTSDPQGPAPAPARSPSAASPTPEKAPAHRAVSAQATAAVVPKAEIASIDFDDEDDDEPDDRVDVCDLTLEQLKAAWSNAADSQVQRIRSVMRRAELSFEGDVLLARVSSLLAQNMLRTEAESIRGIKADLRCPDLRINVEYDASLAPPEKPKEKAMGPKEQWQTMMAVNPEIDNLRLRLGLEYDE